MRYVEVDGLRVSVIGLGTWQFGTREWGYGHEYAHQIAPDLVHRATAMGITLIDTAESYGPRTSEHIVDEGLVRRAAVSNYSLAQWQEAERALRHPVYADQVPFSLVKPRPAADLVPYAAAMGRIVVAYSPLGQGVLARVGAGS